MRPPLHLARRDAIAGLSATLALGACGRGGSAGEPPTTASAPAPVSQAHSETATTIPTSPQAPTYTPTPGAPATATPQLPSLTGETRNTWAFAPLADPGDVVVEGMATSQRAWSTSKVLVVAAFLQVTGATSRDQLSAANADALTRALDESHMLSLLQLRSQVPDRAAVMTGILRSIGDESTVAPGTKEGRMEWTVQEQVRFMAALGSGRVVSEAASELLLAHLTPVASQRWGLGTIGARAYKGGWLTAESETRQMGIVGDHAVAILTKGIGPAVLQSDNDYAHVEQLNILAGMLQERLRLT